MKVRKVTRITDIVRKENSMTNKEKLEAIRAEIERLMYAYNQEADIASAEDSIGEKVAVGKYDVCKHLLSLIDSQPEEPVSDDFEMALAEMIGNAQKSVIEPWVIAAQWKDELIKLAKSEEPVSEDLEEAIKEYTEKERLRKAELESPFFMPTDFVSGFKAGAKWQKENLWKPADGDDLPEIDREVIALTQPFPDDDEHLRVVFAHRPNKYAKVWNSDLGEEQIVEVERYGKGEWNIPNAKYWLDVELSKEIEL